MDDFAVGLFLTVSCVSTTTFCIALTAFDILKNYEKKNFLSQFTRESRKALENTRANIHYAWFLLKFRVFLRVKSDISAFDVIDVVHICLPFFFFVEHFKTLRSRSGSSRK